MILSLIVIIAAAALILYTLITRRNRLMDLHSKWLLFLGVGVLPVPAILMTTAVGLEHSKAVSFCNSCHAMDPFIDDMRNVESDLLAASHFKNRLIQKEHCYTCHTDYGIFGTMEAKLAGLGHVWKDASGRWQAPIEISKPYQFRICLNCHAGAVRFENQEVHEGVIDDVVNGEISCTDCHEPAHPARSERSADS
jgi:nitrate/TMAO reductase-like tetraheme cytochrome c subunit